MNWGTRIFISFAVFATIIISLVVISFRQDFHLVADDYYKQEIEYQSQITKIENFKLLNQPLSIKYSSQEQRAAIQFPVGKEDMPAGEIHFFRPSNGKLDFKVAIQTDAAGSQMLDLSQAVPGLWKVKVSWQADGQSYYDEQTLVL